MEEGNIFKEIARSEEDDRRARLAAERINRERLEASESRRPDDI